MNEGLLPMLRSSRRRGVIPTFDGATWRPLPFAGARVTRSSDQSGFASGTATYTAISFELAQFDTHGFWGIDPNPTRLTIPGGMGGYYEIGFNFALSSMTANVVRGLVRRNGGAAAGGDEPLCLENRIFSLEPILNAVTCQLLSQGDYLELYVSQDSGSNQTVRGTSGVNEHTPVFWLRRVGLDASPNPRQGA